MLSTNIGRNVYWGSEYPVIQYRISWLESFDLFHRKSYSSPCDHHNLFHCFCEINAILILIFPDNSRYTYTERIAVENVTNCTIILFDIIVMEIYRYFKLSKLV
jgi:hypothetical protein